MHFLIKLAKYCRCELRVFDFKKYKAPHIQRLRTYAWKPLVIQEVLNTESLVIYVDSSIEFLSNKLKPSLTTAIDNGIASQTLNYFNLTCYTNPKMFEWFGESISDYTNMPTLEANIIMLRSSFVTSLIMKAWITCALDETCISPKGLCLDLSPLVSFHLINAVNLTNRLPFRAMLRVP